MPVIEGHILLLVFILLFNIFKSIFFIFHFAIFIGWNGEMVGIFESILKEQKKINSIQ